MDYNSLMHGHVTTKLRLWTEFFALAISLYRYSLHPPASEIYRRKTLQIYNFKMRLADGCKYARAIYSANLVVLTHNGVLNVNGTNAMKLAYV